MSRHQPRPWHLYLLVLVGVALAILAVSDVGAPTSSARTSKQVVTAQKGVVQSSASGSGNVEAGTDLNVNFRTSGTLMDVYVHKGQHVQEGRLLARLDPTAARLSLKDAQETLVSADDQLSSAESNSSSTSTSLENTSSSSTEFVSDTTRLTETTANTATTSTTLTSPTTPSSTT